MTGKGDEVRSFFTKTPCVTATGVCGALLILLGACLGWAYLPGMLDRKVVERVVLVDDSPAFERWRRLPQPLVTKFYLFNVTNPEEVQDGARPVLRELGPYVYDEYIEKVNIEKHEDSGTISYYLKNTFFFNQELSGNLSTSDVVTILNIPLLATVLKVKRYFPFALKLVDPILAEIFPLSDSIFLTGTVSQLLFDGVVVVNCSSAVTGTADMVCDQLENQLPDTVEKTPDNTYKFSFYKHKNRTSKGRYTVDRGLSDPKSLLKVVGYNGKGSVQAWHEQRCNLINGTDGMFFPPLITGTDPLVMFSSDICRSVTLKFEQKTQYRGIPVIRYVNDPEFLGDPAKYPENKCYCLGRSHHRTCLKEGVLDLSPCTGAAVVLSYPHLYMADPEYSKFPEGVSPASQEHESFLEVEPRTGVPLRGSKKVQVNMFLTRVPEVRLLRNVSEGLFPAMWMDEGIEVNDNNLLLLHSLNNMVNTFYTARWMAIILGIALCVAACMAFYSRKKNCGSYDNRVNPFKQQGNLNMGFVHDNSCKPSSPPDVTKTSLTSSAVSADSRVPSSIAKDGRRSSASSAAVSAERKGSSCAMTDSSRNGTSHGRDSRATADDPSSPVKTAGVGACTPCSTAGGNTPSSRTAAQETNSLNSLGTTAPGDGSASPHPATDSNSNSSSADDAKSTTSVRSVEDAKDTISQGSKEDLAGFHHVDLTR